MAGANLDSRMSRESLVLHSLTFTVAANESGVAGCFDSALKTQVRTGRRDSKLKREYSIAGLRSKSRVEANESRLAAYSDSTLTSMSAWWMRLKTLNMSLGSLEFELSPRSQRMSLHAQGVSTLWQHANCEVYR